MESLFVGRTTIMVAHKLSTVAVADMIAGTLEMNNRKL